jgi:hypothetical protein
MSKPIQGGAMQSQQLTPNPWPFKYVNGHQTPQSKALMADKGQHRSTPFDLNDIEEALL